MEKGRRRALQVCDMDVVWIGDERQYVMVEEGRPHKSGQTDSD